MKLNRITLAVLTLSASPTIYAAENHQTTSEPTAITHNVSKNEATELTTINVKAKAARAISEATNSYQRDRVNLGLLGRQNAFTTPITVVNYDEKAFADKNPRNMVDAIAQTDASVMTFGGETNTLQGLYVRGLQLDARQFSVNGLAGLYSAYSSPTSKVGAAQLIKGASSATVGMDPEGAVGSSVNIETKKAPDEGIRKIGLSWYGKTRWQPEIDFGQRFGANKQFGIRLNGQYRDGDTMREQFSETNREASINLDYRGTDFQAALDASYAKRATRGGRARIQDIQQLNFQLPAAPDGKTNLVPAWQRQTTEDQTTMFTFNWTPNDWVAISGGIGHMESKYAGNFGQIEILNTAGDYRNGTYNATTGRWAARGTQPVSFISRTTSANLKALGYAQTGNITHTWNAALDYIERSRDHDNGTRVNSNVMTGLNIYHPNLPEKPSNFDDSQTPNQGADTTYKAPSLALSDTLGFANNRLRLTLGGRLQWIKQQDHTNQQNASAHRFSPMILAAWVPNQNFVLYGNYMEDLEPGAVDDDGNMAQPRVSKQIELGVRKNWGNIVTSANIYQITRPTYWRAAGTYNGIAHIAGEAQGKERVRGLELNTYANLLNKTLRPYLGIALTKHDLINAPSFSGSLINGTQVASPRIIAKTGIEWATPFVQNLTLNAGIQYYGKSYQDSAKQYSFRPYTVVDAGMKYEIKTKDNHSLTLRGGVENLFNKKYWQVQRGQYDRSFAVLGMPRTFWLKMDYTF